MQGVFGAGFCKCRFDEGGEIGGGFENAGHGFGGGELVDGRIECWWYKVWVEVEGE